MTPKDEAHFKLLRILELEPDITQRELARRLGVSMGKANYLLNGLIEKGLVKAGNFSRGEHKLNKLIYLLTPAGFANRVQLTRSYLARKEVEYEALRTEIDSLRQAQIEAESNSQ